MDILYYLRESIKLELNASKLYLLFSEYNEEDNDFWWKLSIEESNHAALLKSGINYINVDKFPIELLPKNIDNVIKVNNQFDDIINDYKTNPSREKSFEIAIKLEESAGESHYENIMNTDTDNRIIKIFQQLNTDDNNHVNRIKKRYEKIKKGQI